MLRSEVHIHAWLRERRVAQEELGDGNALVSFSHWLQHGSPVVGAMNVAFAEQRPFQIAALVEQEQRVIAGAGEVAVVTTRLPAARRSC
jgi:hypothetical protein